MRWLIAGIMTLGIVVAIAAGWTGRIGMMITGIALAAFFGFILVGIYAIQDQRAKALKQQLEEAKAWREGTDQ